MANPKIPFNPMLSSEEFSKNPKNMSLEELEILLHSKRLNIKLDLERLEKKINYTKLIFSIVRNTEIGTMLEKLFTKQNIPKT